MNIEKLGFSTQNSGSENIKILQAAVDEYKEIEITDSGVYEVAGTVYLDDDVTLTFGKDVVIKRVDSGKGKNGYFLVNRGAFTGKYNKNITIKGLSLVENNIESAAALSVDLLPELMEQGEDTLNDYYDETIIGLRGQLSFMYVENLKIYDFTLNDLCSWDYAVQISDFRNIEIDTVHIEGNKDAIHFGTGKGFILRNGTFRTKDDPIALNADDYSPSAPTIGTIEDGLIENCIDLDQESTYGYFVRLLIGSQGEWKKGMEVMHSDSVIYEGREYRSVLPDDGTRKISLTPPTHEKGFKIIDGIAWVRVHGGRSEKPQYTADIKNVTFRNLISEKTRKNTVILYVCENNIHRGRREDTPIPKIENIVFDDIKIKGETETAFLLCAPADKLTIKNCDLNGAGIRFEQGSCGIGKYPASFSLENVRNFRLDDANAFRNRNADDAAYTVKY